MSAPLTTPASPPSDEKATRHPPWLGPHGSSELQVHNSLTSTKVPFVPANGRTVGWYTCGPTVYDSAHLGHARCYVTFDIIRRIMSDYFKYNVFYVMNITDIDDKIIMRSRRNHLLSEYRKTAVDPKVVDGDIKRAFSLAVESGQKKVAAAEAALKEAEANNKYVEESRTARDEERAKLTLLLTEQKAYEEEAAKQLSSADAKAAVAGLLSKGQGALSDRLDVERGGEVTDHSIFKAHASKFEQEFLSDMRALGVRDVDALTRVSEYVDHIIEYVQTIIKNGFAYEAQGSVYFDTAAFTKAGFHYAKLNPWAVGNLSLSASGEGSLTSDALGRKSGQDFALWKLSKRGEPAWDSPWGQGRPGWHIECSAMASDILGTNIDIHSGGVDLKFPHHDNELAQSEGHSGCQQWVNHFWHAGHLNIAGLKMSKSLKNFLTIRDVLQRYSGRVIRFLFLLTPWDTTMNFSDDSLKAAQTKEKELNEFFQNTAIALRAKPEIGSLPQRWSAVDRALHAKLMQVQQEAHQALCDNFDYPKVMQLISELVSETNKYRISKNEAGEALYQPLLLQQIARWVDSMLRVFGVVPDPEPGFAGGSSGEESKKLAGVLDAACAFRDSMRDAARSKKTPQEVLSLCDQFRDESMVQLGVRMEDVAAEGGGALRSVWKLDDPAKLVAERAEKRKQETAAKLSKASNKLDKLLKDQTKLTDARVSPKEFFATQGDKYGQFDEQGKPTHDAAGKELAKSALKTVSKLWDTKDKAHKDYQAKMEKNPNLMEDMEKEKAQLQEEIERLQQAVKEQGEQ